MINEFTKNRNIVIGKIDIFKNFSFFEVENAYENLILKSFYKKDWNGEKLIVEKSKAPKDQDVKSSTENKRKKRKSANRLKNNTRSYPKGKEKKGSFKEKFKKSKRRS